jgi:CheY-like chemotaxis protein
VAARLLERLGYEVDVASTGKEAVAAFERRPYAAILMDGQMPETDGFEATRLIRAREGDRHTPIIAVTASAMRGDRERCLAAGMDDYIYKPVRLEDLEAVLQRWVRNPGMAKSPSTAQSAGRSADGPSVDEALDVSVLARLQHLNQPGREHAFQELIDMFLDDTPPRLASLREAAARQDAAALIEVSHALKGAAAHFGAHELATRCEQLEQLARGGTLEGAEELLQRMEDAFARARLALENVQARPLPTAQPRRPRTRRQTSEAL